MSIPPERCCRLHLSKSLPHKRSRGFRVALTHANLGRPKTEDRRPRPKTEDRRPKTEDRRPKTEDRSLGARMQVKRGDAALLLFYLDQAFGRRGWHGPTLSALVRNVGV